MPGSARPSTPRCRPSGWPRRRPWECSRPRHRPNLGAGPPRPKRSRRRRHRPRPLPRRPLAGRRPACPSLAESSPRRRHRLLGVRATTTRSSGGRSSGAPGAAEVLLHRFYDHGLSQASYLLGCERTGEALVVDPNRDVSLYLETAAEYRLRIAHVTETHIHADFVSGSRELVERTGARIYLSGEGGRDWSYGFAAG